MTVLGSRCKRVNLYRQWCRWSRVPLLFLPTFTSSWNPFFGGEQRCFWSISRTSCLECGTFSPSGKLSNHSGAVLAIIKVKSMMRCICSNKRMNKILMRWKSHCLSMGKNTVFIVQSQQTGILGWPTQTNQNNKQKVGTMSLMIRSALRILGKSS